MLRTKQQLKAAQQQIRYLQNEHKDLEHKLQKELLEERTQRLQEEKTKNYYKEIVIDILEQDPLGKFAENSTLNKHIQDQQHICDTYIT